MNREDSLRRPLHRESWDAERFRVPTVTDRPGFRWWWQSPQSPARLVAELREIAAAGFGEVEIAFSAGFWADDAQRAALVAVLEEGERLGVGVGMTLGSEWPLRTPNTSAGTEYASKELQYGVVRVEPGHRGALDVPKPFDDDDGSRSGELLAVTAARVVRWGGSPTIDDIQTPIGPRRIINPPDESTLLDESSLVDVTDAVEGGRLTWTEQEGDWAVFGFWLRDTLQGATSFLDRAAATAATEFLDEHQIAAENFELLSRAGTELFEDSLELNADSLFWSPDFLERFRRRHDYDPVKYLPLFYTHGMCRYWVPNEEPTPDFDVEGDSGARLRQDYYRLVTDLYVTDHLLLLQEWAVGHGLRHKAQVAYGQNLEPVRSNRDFVRHGGRAEGESLNSGDRAPVDRDHPNWRFALDWQRSVVGGAHQGGTTRISTELGAQFAFAYSLTLGDLRQMLDKEWAAGITKPYVHGYASQAEDRQWPTQSRFWDYVADSWNHETFPEWANWAPLTDYWARGTVALETGIARTDVAFYRDGFLTTAARGLDPSQDHTAPARLADTDGLEGRGYSVQFLDPIGIEEATLSLEGELFPEGPAYRALVIDERAMTPGAAEAVARAGAGGLAVVFVGELPSADSGFALGADGHRRVQDAVAAAMASPRVVRVDTADEVADALVSVGVSPRVSWTGTPLLTQWRDAGDRRIVLVYNPFAHPVVEALALEGVGAVRELLLESGDTVSISAREAEGHTAISVALAPLGLRVFELALTETPDPSLETPAFAFELAIDEWTLDVRTEEPDGARDIHLAGQGPADWREVQGLEGVSGVGRYRAVVRPAADVDGAIIDLGAIGGSAVIRIGEATFGPVYVAGQPVDLGAALDRDAPTVIEIEVRTPLRNAVVASQQRPYAGPTTRPQGLIGPVVVRGYRA